MTREDVLELIDAELAFQQKLNKSYRGLAWEPWILLDMIGEVRSDHNEFYQHKWTENPADRKNLHQSLVTIAAFAIKALEAFPDEEKPISLRLSDWEAYREWQRKNKKADSDS